MAEEGRIKGKVADLVAYRVAIDRSARRFRADPAAAALLGLVAKGRGVSLPDLLDVGRGRARTAAARQLAMYLANTMLGLTLTEVGALFGRDRTTVAHACRLVEDRRDERDPAFDRELAELEAAVDHLLKSPDSPVVEVRHARG